MSALKLIKEGEPNVYPYSEEQLAVDFPHTVFTKPFTEEGLRPFGVFIVFSSQKPVFNSWTQRLVESEPEKENDNRYFERWVVEDLSPAEITVKLQALFAQKRAAIFAKYEEEMAFLKSQAPDAERESWSIQIEEARLYVADPDTAEVPWLTIAANARGITRADLAARILGKNAAFRQLHGAITGHKQYLEDQIEAAFAAEDPVELQNVNVNIGWPVLPG